MILREPKSLDHNWFPVNGITTYLLVYLVKSTEVVAEMSVYKLDFHSNVNDDLVSTGIWE